MLDLDENTDVCELCGMDTLNPTQCVHCEHFNCDDEIWDAEPGVEWFKEQVRRELSVEGETK